MTGLRDLPPELKDAVIEALANNEDHSLKKLDIKIAGLAALSLTDRYFHQLLSPMLYKLGSLRHPYLLCWATEVGNLNVMKKILDTGLLNPYTGILRYNLSQEYAPWDPKTMSAGERFRSFYRRSGSPFQHQIDIVASLTNGFLTFTRFASPEDESLSRAGGHGGYSFGAGIHDRDMFRDYLYSEQVQRDLLGTIRSIRYSDVDDDFDVATHSNWTMCWFPVHIASRSGNLPALELLVQFGALLHMPSRGFCCQRYRMPIYGPRRDGSHPAWSAFHVALCHGHTEAARYMLKVCPHIRERLRTQQEPSGAVFPVFISAIRHGYPDLAEFSLEQGIDNARGGDPDFFGVNLLWRAFWETENFKDALTILLRHGADIDHDLGQGHTLLVEACLYGNFDEALALIDAGADVTVVLKSPGRGSTLERNEQHSDTFIFEGYGVLGMLCSGRLPLFRSVSDAPEPQMSPSPSSYDALLRRLVYSDARNISSAKQSPLHIAAAGHNKPAIALLLDSGMDPTVLDEEGVDVVVRASKSNFRDRDLWGEKASILANLPDLDKFGQTFYMLLDLFRDRRGKESTASTIAMPGVDKSRVIDGDTALRNLLEGNFLELNRTSRLTRIRAALDLVASEFADINTRDRFGRTLLMVAVADGHDTIVPTLIKYGAKIETDDLAAVWIDWNITRDNKLYQKGETSAIYRLLCTFDVEKRILRDPWFFAYAMYERQDDVIKLMINDLEAPHRILTGGEAWEKLSGEVHDLISVIEEDDDRSDATRNSVLCQPPKRFPRNGSSLVQVAVELDYQFVVEKLIKEYGLAANQFDPDGQSLFHIVVRYKTFESDQMIRLLRRLGADINTTDVNGDSPLSLHCKELLCFGDRYKGSACFIEFFGCRVLESLVLCGSKPSLRNNEGETVLELMDRIRNHAEQVPFNLQGILRGKLLYHVMLYRQSIGM